MHGSVIAAIQTTPEAGDVAANTAQHIELAHDAASRGATVLLYPELSLTGYELGQAESLAFDRDDDRLAPLAEVAAAHRITLLVGLPLRERDGLRIATAILGPDGERAFYLKWCVHASETPPFEAPADAGGSNNPRVSCGDVTGAMAVCADFNHDRHAERAARAGAGVYLVSAFVSAADSERDLARLRTLARRHAFEVVFSNFGCPSGGIEAGGRSAWIRPDGAVPSVGPAEGVAIVLARSR